MTPKLTDLILYVTKKITGADWNTNWQKIVTWFTGGSADVKFNSVDTNSVTTSGQLKGNSLDVTNGANIGGNLTVGGVLSGDGSGLTNIKSTSTIAYTPFTVNSAYIDTTELSATYGKEIPMEKDSENNNLIKFNVSANFPLVATTSDGVTFKLEQIDSFDVANTQDGTYVVCVKKGQQRAELKEGANGVYRQRLAPTDVSIPNNTLWLDTSKENIQCYERLNNDWTTKYDGVPVGEVVVSGGEVSSITVYHYNWNGYNINVQEKTTMSQRPVVIIETYYAGNINWSSKQEQTDYYIKYSNGLVIQGGRAFGNSGAGDNPKPLPLNIPLTKICSVNMIGIHWGDRTGDGSVRSISGGTVTVSIGAPQAVEGEVLWEVKGYI